MPRRWFNILTLRQCPRIWAGRHRSSPTQAVRRKRRETGVGPGWGHPDSQRKSGSRLRSGRHRMPSACRIPRRNGGVCRVTNERPLTVPQSSEICFDQHRYTWCRALNNSCDTKHNDSGNTSWDRPPPQNEPPRTGIGPYVSSLFFLCVGWRSIRSNSAVTSTTARPESVAMLSRSL